MNLRIKYRRHRRAKNITLRVGSDGSVVITRPWFVPQKIAEMFLRQKADWIKEKLKDIKPNRSKDDYLKGKEQARELILERLNYFNQFYGFNYKRVSVRNQKSRWGSCSRDGNLNFNYKVLFLTKEVRDYIVVHELCHLKELNHSARFWALVARTVPNYKQLRKNLKNIQ